MPIEWDPKIDGPRRTERVAGPSPSRPARASRPGPTPIPIEPGGRIEEPTRAPTHPTRAGAHRTTLATSEATLASLRLKLERDRIGRERTAREALRTVVAYPFRRSRGIRRKAVDLCETLAERLPDLSKEARWMSVLLRAEGDLHALDAERALEALAGVAEVLDGVGSNEELRAFASAVAASACIQIALRYPGLRRSLEEDLDVFLGRALRLAEDAVAANPSLPDGYVQIGRILLMQEDADGVREAAWFLHRALELDPEHDPAHAALALHHLENDDVDLAADHIEAATPEGSGHPAALLLRARIALRRDAPEAAARDLERALAMATRDGLLQLEAAFLWDRLGRPKDAATCLERARLLLGPDFDDLRAALLETMPREPLPTTPKNE